MKTAVFYARTSSASGVGEDKDSLARQTAAVEAYAKAHHLEIVKRFYDPAVSGADPVDQRPGFTDMLQYMLGNGARIILVENASRFARDLAVQLTGHDLLRDRGIALVPVDAPDYFTEETPTAVMVRSILGAVSQFERMNVVERLRQARIRTGRLGGPVRIDDKTKQLARRLAPKRSLRAVAAELQNRGYVTTRGTQYSPAAVKRMLL